MFVSKEIAVKLKEKGFKEKCFGYYLPSGNAGLIYNFNQWRGGIFEDCLCSHNSLDEDIVGNDLIDAPTIEQVLRWLRMEICVHIEPCILADCDIDADAKMINTHTYWSFSITVIETGHTIYFEYDQIDDKRFDSYEQAALAAIEYVLDNLI